MILDKIGTGRQRQFRGLSRPRTNNGWMKTEQQNEHIDQCEAIFRVGTLHHHLVSNYHIISSARVKSIYNKESMTCWKLFWILTLVDRNEMLQILYQIVSLNDRNFWERRRSCWCAIAIVLLHVTCNISLLCASQCSLSVGTDHLSGCRHLWDDRHSPRLKQWGP